MGWGGGGLSSTATVAPPNRIHRKAESAQLRQVWGVVNAWRNMVNRPASGGGRS